MLEIIDATPKSSYRDYLEMVVGSENAD